MDDLVENSKVLSIGLDELLDQGNSTPRPTKKDKKARERPKIRGPEAEQARLSARLLSSIRKMVGKAQKNIVRFEDFSVKEAILEPKRNTDWPLPTSWVDWEYDPNDPNPTLAVDRDWIPIILWMPKFLADAGHMAIQMVLVEFGNAIKSSLKMGCGADSTGRNAKSAYRIAKGEISGCINLAVWHAVGHTSTPAILSKPQLGSCVNYSACASVVSEISLVSERVNETLRCLDSEAHASHLELAESLSKAYPHVRGRAAIDPILFQGRSIIYNRQTPNHLDQKDPKLGWNPLTVAGTFTGGRLRIRRLGLRMWFGGGACAFVRGAILEHEIEEFDGGQRISIAHFCHDSLWKEMGITLRSSGITA